MWVVMYVVDRAALLDGRADTKQSDGPRYPATDASSGRIYASPAKIALLEDRVID